MSQSKKNTDQKGKKFMKAGLIIFALSVFPVISLILQILMRAILRPEADTTQNAVINIVSVLSIPIGIISGAILVFIGMRMQKKSK